MVDLGEILERAEILRTVGHRKTLEILGQNVLDKSSEPAGVSFCHQTERTRNNHTKLEKKSILVFKVTSRNKAIF